MARPWLTALQGASTVEDLTTTLLDVTSDAAGLSWALANCGDALVELASDRGLGSKLEARAISFLEPSQPDTVRFPSSSNGTH